MSNLLAITYDDFAPVTKDDDNDLIGGAVMGLLVTAAGTLRVTTRCGTIIALAAVIVGQEIHVPIARVWSTGTTATVVGLVGGPFFGSG